MFTYKKRAKTEFYLTLPGVKSFSGPDSLYLFGKLLSNLKCAISKIFRDTGKYD